ncbi:CNNM domain-containing protein [Halosegnis sp.]|uniref:CNNM domain-containing protein n=1 Tax=Halosegnis sp. TaxID=2864959 RepID=UPI0035D505DF
MVDLVTALRLGGGALLLLSNGFFVTTEFALTRVRQFAESEFEGLGLTRAWEMTERLEIYLSGCQVGITVSSVGLGVVAEPALAAVLDPAVRALGLAGGSGGHTALSVVLALAVINLLHVIVGEQAPTYLGIERTKFVARYGAPLLYWWTKLMSPVILLSDRIAKGVLGLFGIEIARSWADEELEGERPPETRGELMRDMSERLRGLGVSSERRDEVLNALAIDEIRVSDIMIDRENIVAVSTVDDIETNVERMAESPHVRFPLVGESIDEFVGIVYTPAVLRHLDELTDGSLDLRELTAPPLTVAADTPVSELIDRLQRENQELALVERNDEIVGLVTATDAFEQITGELEDPLDLQAG